MMKINDRRKAMKFSSVFWLYIRAFTDLNKFILSIGGTRSTKTYSAIQLIHIKAQTTSNLVVLMLGRTIPYVKRELVETFKEIAGPDYIPNNYNITDRVYTYVNGSKIYFDSAESEDKFVGTETDYVLLDEANLYPEGEGITKQLAMRNKGGIILTMNPSRSLPWIDNIKANPRTFYIHSTYKDNEHLPQDLIDYLEYEGSVNPRFSAVYLYGKYMANSDVAILTNWDITSAWPEEYKWRTWGADFGMKDPNTLVETVFYNNELWVKCHLYKPDMVTDELYETFKEFADRELIHSDSSEPRLIKELQARGLYTFGVKKYNGSVMDGIRALQNIKINVHFSSKEAIREMEDYQFIKRQGVILDKPEDKNNHFIDALRYSIQDKLVHNQGRYSFGVR